ncbi:splicing factor, CC1-like protein [Tothia fuscella]|uniref:Splicing factor, CC1-like protein n=1 Tax=Tothia fuscella TaxID=1048955 RepID=A0A9P4NUK0_9PEZI|nr:splicing factor, CC1-like protein [Tothia fuscella]
MTSDKGSAKKSSRRRSRSPDRDHGASRRERRRDSPERDRGGDFYRGSGRPRTRSVSADGSRYYRPSGSRSSRPREDRDDRDSDRPSRLRDSRDRDRERDRAPRDHRDNRDRDNFRGNGRGGGGGGGRDRRRGHSGERKKNDNTPPLNEDERDRRTVFVQQLAARLRTKDLITFFGKVGDVKEAQIVKDRISGRSKGVGYVEFKNEESVAAAIQLTGQKLLGIPIIAQLTEAEKNRQSRTTEHASQNPGVPFHRLYVGNIHFSVTEEDLSSVFEPFGELEFVSLQREEQGRSRGYGFVQFRDPNAAKEALEKMNGFDLAGRPIRVGLGNDKFTNESTANLLQRFPGQAAQYQGSAFSGSGGRGAHAGGLSNFDRAGGRDNDKAAGGASALDDTDVAGVNFNNYSRDSLMRKLARTDEPAADKKLAKPAPRPTPIPANVPQASKCIVLHNMFDAAEEEAADPENWQKLLEADVRKECENKYGPVFHLALEPNNGDIYIKFHRVEGGEKAMQGLNGRFFGGRMITAQPMVDAVYSSLFGRTKAG